MRSKLFLVLAALLGAAALFFFTATTAGGEGTNPVNPPPARLPRQGPVIALVGVRGEDIPDKDNTQGTYVSAPEDHVVPEADAGIGVNVKPGGGFDAHLLIAYAKKEVRGKDGKTRKVADPSSAALKGYVPQGNAEPDNLVYTAFTTANEARSAVQWDTIKGVVTVGPGGAIALVVNGRLLGYFELEKDAKGGIHIWIYHLKVDAEPPPAPGGEQPPEGPPPSGGKPPKKSGGGSSGGSGGGSGGGAKPPPKK